MSASRPSRVDHLPQIDVLRGLAVLAVLLFHAYPSVFPIGYLGVDVFFVVSGFVIARTYLAALATRSIAWRTFWIKRFRRLLPAYLVCILATTALAVVVLEPHVLVEFGKSLLFQPVYLQNVHFWSEGDYFADALSRPLLHTWSLGIEEQFYLLFFVPVLLWRHVRHRIFVALLLVALALSVAATVIVGDISPKTAFYLLPFRMWEFMAGIAAFALTGRLTPRPERLRWASFTIGMGGLLLVHALLRPAQHGEFSSVNLLLVVSLTAILLGHFQLGHARNVLPRSFLPLAALGLVSYSLYLWHWPLISLWSQYLGRKLSAGEASACLVVSLLLAIATYRWVETPFRRHRAERSTRPLVLSGLCGNLSIVVAGVVLMASSGALFRYPQPERAWLRISQDRSPYRCPNLERLFRPGSELCAVNDVTDGAGVLIVGDSHADQLDEAIGELGQRANIPMFMAARNCDIDEFASLSSCDETVLTTLLDEARSLGVTHILAISSWVDGRSFEPLERAVSMFLDRGFDLVVAETNPVSPYFNPRTRAYASVDGKDVAPFTREDFDTQNAALDATLVRIEARYPDRVSVISPADAICHAHGRCDWLDAQGRPLFFDDGHLSIYGVGRVLPYYRKALESVETHQ